MHIICNPTIHSFSEANDQNRDFRDDGMCFGGFAASGAACGQGRYSARCQAKFAADCDGGTSCDSWQSARGRQLSKKTEHKYGKLVILWVLYGPATLLMARLFSSFYFMSESSGIHLIFGCSTVPTSTFLALVSLLPCPDLGPACICGGPLEAG